MNVNNYKVNIEINFPFSSEKTQTLTLLFDENVKEILLKIR